MEVVAGVLIALLFLYVAYWFFRLIARLGDTILRWRDNNRT